MTTYRMTMAVVRGVRAGDISGYTVPVTDAVADAAAAVARGKYQARLVSGVARWSGSDLTGAARRWSGRYAESRATLRVRLMEAGIRCIEVTGVRGRRVVVLAQVTA